MGTIFTMAFKDIRLLRRDKFGLFWVIIFPLLMALFFGSIFSSGGNTAGSMKIALVDQQKSDQSREFAAQLSTNDVLKVTPMPLDSARALVQRGKLVAYVLLKPDSSGDFYNPFAMPPMEIGIDPARKAESGYLQGMVTEAWFKQMQANMTDPEMSRNWINSGLAEVQNDTSLPADQRSVLQNLLNSYGDFLDMTDTAADTAAAKQTSPFGSNKIDVVEVTMNRNEPRSAFEITFPQALNWALLGCTLTFALSIVQERTRGTYHRLRIAPVSRAQILAGKGVACFLTAFVDCVVLLLIGMVIFGVRIEGIVPIGIALIASSICFVGLMMLISVIGRTEQAVGGAGWAIMLVMSMVGGGMVPLMAMPSWMLTMSNFSVVKWAIYAFEGAIWRGFTLSQMMLPASILIAVGLAAYAIGVSVLIRIDR